MRLDVDGLNVWRGARHVLRDLDLSLDLGVVVLTGRNGAGKSSLLKALFGLIPAASGQALLDGRPFLGEPPRQLRDRGIAYMPQGGQVFPLLSCRENLLISASAKDGPQAIRARMAALIERFPSLQGKLHVRAGALSGGQRQQLAFAMAAMPRPRLMLLDEPLAGLSADSVDLWLDCFRVMIQKEGIAVLVVEQRNHLLADTAAECIELVTGAARRSELGGVLRGGRPGE